MKIIEKLALILYSFLVLVISAVICLLIFGIIDTKIISDYINIVLNDSSASIIALAVSIVFILLSIRCLFFRKRKQIKKSNTTDILLENESGRLLISKTAIENAVKNIINDTMTVSTDTKVVVDIDPANYVSVYIVIMLNNSIKVKKFTIDLQLKVKEKIKEDFDLDVKQVNIKIDSNEKQIEKKNNETKKISAKKDEKIVEVISSSETLINQTEEQNENQVEKQEDTQTIKSTVI